MNASNLLAQALIHFLWQGCLLAVLYAAMARGLQRFAAATRYLAGVATLLLMAACLPATLLVLPSPRPTVVDAWSDPRAIFGPAEIAPVPARSVADDRQNDSAREALSASVAPTSRAAPAVAVEVGRPAWRPAADRIQSILVRASPYASGLYLCGVVLMLSRVLAGLWGGHRLSRDCTPLAEGTICELLQEHVRRMKMRVVPVVAYCQRISVPIVVGVLRPMILLPAVLASGLTPAQLEAVLLHELAHVRRYDLAVNLLQRLVEALLFFHPAVWWLSRRRERRTRKCLRRLGSWLALQPDRVCRRAGACGGALSGHRRRHYRQGGPCRTR